MKLKRVAAFILCGTMVSTALTGCGKKQTGAGEGEKLDLSIHMHFFNYCIFNDEWPVFKVAAEKTGVSLHGTAVETVSDSGQAFSTMLADKKLPDIIHYQRTKLKEIGEEGALIPLEDLIEEHAPNIKKFFDASPAAKAAATSSDGHIYCIPGTLAPVGSGALPSVGFFIRQDWLDKLGLSVPKTVDEYYNVLKAFKERDPNGNGKADEIPYFKRSTTVQDLYQLFGASYGDYINENDMIADGKVQEEYKNAVKELAKWYKEGLIDPEIFSRGNQAREQLLSSNIGGSTHDWFSSTAAYNDMYKDVGINFVPIAPPADVNGVVKEVTSRSAVHSLAWGISKDNEHPERTIKYFDWWLTEEGIKLHSNGVEGLHYDMIDGKLVFKDEVKNADGGVPGYLRNQGVVEMGTVTTLDAELAGMNELAIAGFNEYNENGYIKEPMPTLSYNQQEQDVINANSTNLSTYQMEMEQKWILGSLDVDATWDEYVAQCKAMKLDDVVAAKNSAYQRYKESIN